MSKHAIDCKYQIVETSQSHPECSTVKLIQYLSASFDSPINGSVNCVLCLKVLLGILSQYSMFHYNKPQLTLITSNVYCFLQTQLSSLRGPVFKIHSSVAIFIEVGQMKMWNLPAQHTQIIKINQQNLN